MVWFSMQRKPSPKLAALSRAHRLPPSAFSPRMEDYLEAISELIVEKGYARAVDISALLNVRSPTVTRMLQRLHGDGFLMYEKYRGIVLTDKGRNLADSVRKRHKILGNFLHLLGVSEGVAQKDAEGLEHHLHTETLDCLARFVNFVQSNPEWFNLFDKRTISASASRT